ncbi:MAG: DUF4364 family protein [Oscillospiraceae bacterium]|nr:DUF4364 family protein [Oscillospiraceae bacterium]
MNEAKPIMTSQSDVKVLICYLFDRLDRPMTTEQLSLICESVGVDYFLLTGAVNDLVSSGALIPSAKGYVQGEKGHISAKEFSGYLPLVFRRQVLKAAVRYFSSAAAIPGCICEVTESDGGAYVHFSLDGEETAIDITVFAGSRTQAESVKDNISRDPVGCYERVIAALTAESEEINVDDLILREAGYGSFGEI